MKLQRYFDISQSSDLPTFERRLIAFSNELGFGLVNAVVVLDQPRKEPAFISVGNTPAAFADVSADVNVSKRNPVIQRLKSSSLPFTYDQAFYVRNGVPEMWERQASFGYANGIAVALHLQDHKHFLLGMDRKEVLPANDEQMVSLLASMQLFAVHAQDAALRLLGVQSVPGEVPALTARELEVLRWTREGKSAWAVGQILSVSHDTVNFHLRNIFRKFGATSKHQAVLQAIAYGLIK